MVGHRLASCPAKSPKAHVAEFRNGEPIQNRKVQKPSLEVVLAGNVACQTQPFVPVIEVQNSTDTSPSSDMMHSDQKFLLLIKGLGRALRGKLGKRCLLTPLNHRQVSSRP